MLLWKFLVVHSSSSRSIIWTCTETLQNSFGVSSSRMDRKKACFVFRRKKIVQGAFWETAYQVVCAKVETVKGAKVSFCDGKKAHQRHVLIFWKHITQGNVYSQEVISTDNLLLHHLQLHCSLTDIEYMLFSWGCLQYRFVENVDCILKSGESDTTMTTKLLKYGFQHSGNTLYFYLFFFVELQQIYKIWHLQKLNTVIKAKSDYKRVMNKPNGD